MLSARKHRRRPTACWWPPPRSGSSATKTRSTTATASCATSGMSPRSTARSTCSTSSSWPRAMPRRNYYAPNGRYQDRLDDAQDNAIREGRGMWTTCDASVSLDPDLEDDNSPRHRTHRPHPHPRQRRRRNLLLLRHLGRGLRLLARIPRARRRVRPGRGRDSVRRVFRYRQLIAGPRTVSRTVLSVPS